MTEFSLSLESFQFMEEIIFDHHDAESKSLVKRSRSVSPVVSIRHANNSPKRTPIASPTLGFVSVKTISRGSSPIADQFRPSSGHVSPAQVRQYSDEIDVDSESSSVHSGGSDHSDTNDQAEVDGKTKNKFDYNDKKYSFRVSSASSSGSSSSSLSSVIAAPVSTNSLQVDDVHLDHLEHIQSEEASENADDDYSSCGESEDHKMLVKLLPSKGLFSPSGETPIRLVDADSSSSDGESDNDTKSLVDVEIPAEEDREDNGSDDNSTISSLSFDEEMLMLDVNTLVATEDKSPKRIPSKEDNELVPDISAAVVKMLLEYPDPETFMNVSHEEFMAMEANLDDIDGVNEDGEFDDMPIPSSGINDDNTSKAASLNEVDQMLATMAAPFSPLPGNINLSSPGKPVTTKSRVRRHTIDNSEKVLSIPKSHFSPQKQQSSSLVNSANRRPSTPSIADVAALIADRSWLNELGQDNLQHVPSPTLSPGSPVPTQLSPIASTVSPLPLSPSRRPSIGTISHGAHLRETSPSPSPVNTDTANRAASPFALFPTSFPPRASACPSPNHSVSSVASKTPSVASSQIELLMDRSDEMAQIISQHVADFYSSPLPSPSMALSSFEQPRIEESPDNTEIEKVIPNEEISSSEIISIDEIADSSDRMLPSSLDNVVNAEIMPHETLNVDEICDNEIPSALENEESIHEDNKNIDRPDVFDLETESLDTFVTARSMAPENVSEGKGEVVDLETVLEVVNEEDESDSNEQETVDGADDADPEEEHVWQQVLQPSDDGYERQVEPSDSSSEEDEVYSVQENDESLVEEDESKVDESDDNDETEEDESEEDDDESGSEDVEKEIVEEEITEQIKEAVSIEDEEEEEEGISGIQDQSSMSMSLSSAADSSAATGLTSTASPALSQSQPSPEIALESPMKPLSNEELLEKSIECLASPLPLCRSTNTDTSQSPGADVVPVMIGSEGANADPDDEPVLPIYAEDIFDYRNERKLQHGKRLIVINFDSMVLSLLAFATAATSATSYVSASDAKEKERHDMLMKRILHSLDSLSHGLLFLIDKLVRETHNSTPPQSQKPNTGRGKSPTTAALTCDDFAVAVTFHGEDNVRHIQWITMSTASTKAASANVSAASSPAKKSKAAASNHTSPSNASATHSPASSRTPSIVSPSAVSVASPAASSRISQQTLTPSRVVVSRQPKVFNANDDANNRNVRKPLVARSSPSKNQTSLPDDNELSKKLPSLNQIKNIMRVIWNENITKETLRMWSKRSIDEISDLRLTSQVIIEFPCHRIAKFDGFSFSGNYEALYANFATRHRANRTASLAICTSDLFLFRCVVYSS